MARGYRDTSTECKVYVGDLSKDAEEKEIERAFGYYGRLKSVWVARNPPGFAFVEYEDPKDAEDAVRALDGTSVKSFLHQLCLCNTVSYVEHLLCPKLSNRALHSIFQINNSCHCCISLSVEHQKIFGVN